MTSGGFACAVTGLLGMVIYTVCAVIGFLGTIAITQGMRRDASIGRTFGVCNGGLLVLLYNHPWDASISALLVHLSVLVYDHVMNLVAGFCRFIKSPIEAAGTPTTGLLLPMGLGSNDLLLHMGGASNDLFLHIGLL